MEAGALHAPAGLNRISIGTPLLRLRSDEQLVAAFRAGNEEAFQVIFDRYRQRLFAYTRQMLSGSRQDAEDALQDVFLRAYGALRANDRPVSLRAWLYRVAHNRCIDQLRRPVPVQADVFDLSRAPLRDPVEESQRREDLRRLVEDVQRLPEAQRSALLMREMDGLSYQELADALDVTVPAIKSLLVRARIGLVEAVEARDTACGVIRTDLMASYDRGVRASGKARRHLRDCAPCRAYRTELRTVQRGLGALAPTDGGPLGLLAKLFGLGGSAAAGGGAVLGGGGAAVGGGVASVTACKVAALVCSAALVTGAATHIEHAVKHVVTSSPSTHAHGGRDSGGTAASGTGGAAAAGIASGSSAPTHVRLVTSPLTRLAGAGASATAAGGRTATAHRQAAHRRSQDVDASASVAALVSARHAGDDITPVADPSLDTAAPGNPGTNVAGGAQAPAAEPTATSLPSAGATPAEPGATSSGGTANGSADPTAVASTPGAGGATSSSAASGSGSTAAGTTTGSTGSPTASAAAGSAGGASGASGSAAPSTAAGGSSATTAPVPAAPAPAAG